MKVRCCCWTNCEEELKQNIKRPVNWGVASHRRLERFRVTRPKIMMQYGCHIHFEILLAVSHPNPNTFSSNLDQLEN